MARYNLNVRVAGLEGVKHSDIIRELNAKGIKVSHAEYYQFKNEKNHQPKSDIVMSEANRIVKEMEDKKNAARNAAKRRGEKGRA